MTTEEATAIVIEFLQEKEGATVVWSRRTIVEGERLTLEILDKAVGMLSQDERKRYVETLQEARGAFVVGYVPRDYHTEIKMLVELIHCPFDMKLFALAAAINR